MILGVEFFSKTAVWLIVGAVVFLYFGISLSVVLAGYVTYRIRRAKYKANRFDKVQGFEVKIKE